MKYLVLLSYVVALWLVVSMFVVCCCDEFLDRLDRIFRRKHKDG